VYDSAEMRSLVERGYDLVAERYARLEGEAGAWPRLEWLDRLLDALPDGSRVLDLGCGNGVPATQRIAQRHHATGVDISSAQVRRARRAVPGAEFLHADLVNLDFSRAPFDAITALYVIEHVPREQHATIFERWYSWLEPGGRLLFTVEPHDEAGRVGQWLGEPMFFSQYDADTTLAMLDRTGFEVQESVVQTQFEGDHDVDYLWILARRPDAGRRAP
jgi:cyclopropane fatty-acyl-phospholipid synthase-like methyltransferase